MRCELIYLHLNILIPLHSYMRGAHTLLCKVLHVKIPIHVVRLRRLLIGP